MTSAAIPDYANLPAPVGYQSFVKDIGPLACDHYALTMAFAAWKLGFIEERRTTSHIFCRSLLNNGDTYKDTTEGDVRNIKIPYLVNAGLGLVAEWYDGWRWSDRELRFLAQVNAPDAHGVAQRVFPNEFLYWLSQQRLTLNIDAVPEGQLLFPQEPSLRLSGLWWQQMAVEAMTLSLISSSTNVATVASQVRLAAQRDARAEGATLIHASAKERASLAEMALRRTASIGGLQSARAAAIAGWDNTSNDYAGMCYNIPVMGTFAHAWVMLHDTEEEAFENWGRCFPSATVFLADTYNTLEGVRCAIRICKKHSLRLMGIRLDSGNLAYLSREARPLLDEAGYKDARILATDSISVRNAASLYGRVDTDARIRESYVTGFGIGSEIALNRNNPLLDFVLKLASRSADTSEAKSEAERDLIKISETEKKTTLPGKLDVIRYIDRDGLWAGDTIIPAEMDVGDGVLNCDVYSEHTRNGRVKPFPKGAPFIRLLKPFMKDGQMTSAPYRNRDAAAILKAGAAECLESLSRLDKAHLLISPDMPHAYGVGIVRELAQKRRDVVSHMRPRADMEKQRKRFGTA